MHHGSSNDGFSLIAVMIALALTGVIAAGMASVASNGMRAAAAFEYKTDLVMLKQTLAGRIDCAATMPAIGVCPSGPLVLRDRKGRPLTKPLATGGAFEGAGELESRWYVKATCSATEGTLAVSVAKADASGRSFATHAHTKAKLDFQHPRHALFGAGRADIRLCTDRFLTTQPSSSCGQGEYAQKIVFDDATQRYRLVCGRLPSLGAKCPTGHRMTGFDMQANAAACEPVPPSPTCPAQQTAVGFDVAANRPICADAKSRLPASSSSCLDGQKMVGFDMPTNTPICATLAGSSPCGPNEVAIGYDQVRSRPVCAPTLNRLPTGAKQCPAGQRMVGYDAASNAISCAAEAASATTCGAGLVSVGFDQRSNSPICVSAIGQLPGHAGGCPNGTVSVGFDMRSNSPICSDRGMTFIQPGHMERRGWEGSTGPMKCHQLLLPNGWVTDRRSPSSFEAVKPDGTPTFEIGAAAWHSVVWEGDVQCPAGTRVVGGGAYCGFSGAGTLLSSYATGSGWKSVCCATYSPSNGLGFSTAYNAAYAVCQKID